MSDLIDRIKELERKERLLVDIQKKVKEDLGRFIQAWDSNDLGQRSQNRAAMISDVKSVFKYVVTRSNSDA
jgi:site-specific recombinase XerD